jgi:hypothetical protein
MAKPRISRPARTTSPASNVVGARFTDTELDAIDAEVKRLHQEQPEAGNASRSSVLRGLVARHLLPRRRPSRRRASA